MVLQGVRVVTTSTTLAAGYCARLLADAGADVILLLPDRPPDRPPGHETFDLNPDSSLARALRRGMSVRAYPNDRTTVPAAALPADILICEGAASAALVGELQGLAPELVTLAITPFGTAGAWTQRPATEFTIQALVGSAINRGSMAKGPLHASGRFADWITGAYAAVAALAALRRARAGRGGEHIDVSEAEAAFVVYTLHQSVMVSLTGQADKPTRSTPIPSVERTSDGWVGLSVNTPEQFTAYAHMIGHPELVDLSDVLNPLRREAHRSVLEETSGPWLLRNTTEQVIAECAHRRIAVAPVSSAGDVVDLPHFVHRQLFTRDERGTPVPRAAVLVDGVTPSAWTPQSAGPSGAAPTGVSTSALPLAGVRVVDLTTWLAGPSATQLLSALGATVIKIESPTGFDGMRNLSARSHSSPGHFEWSWQFLALNTDKWGVALDLSAQDGRAVLERLLADADMLVENGSPGVLPKLGLEWRGVHERHPQLSLLRMPGFGLNGPWSPMRAFDPTISQALGVTALTGYLDGPPVVPRGLCDAIAGIHGAFAALIALFAAEVDGQGHHVESAMCDVLANVLLEWVIECSAPDRAEPAGQSRAARRPAEHLCLCRVGAVGGRCGHRRSSVA